MREKVRDRACGPRLPRSVPGDKALDEPSGRDENDSDRPESQGADTVEASMAKSVSQRNEEEHESGLAELDTEIESEQGPEERLSCEIKFLGTGLGLAIVGRIVESHGGQVRIKTLHGRGTTMSVILPVR